MKPSIKMIYCLNMPVEKLKILKEKQKRNGKKPQKKKETNKKLQKEKKGIEKLKKKKETRKSME